MDAEDPYPQSQTAEQLGQHDGATYPGIRPGIYVGEGQYLKEDPCSEYDNPPAGKTFSGQPPSNNMLTRETC